MEEKNIMPDSKTFVQAVVIALEHLEEKKFGVETFCTIIQNQVHRQAIDILVENQIATDNKEDLDFDRLSIAIFNAIDNLNVRDKEECNKRINQIKQLIEAFGIDYQNKENETAKLK